MATALLTAVVLAVAVAGVAGSRGLDAHRRGLEDPVRDECKACEVLAASVAAAAAATTPDCGERCLMMEALLVATTTYKYHEPSGAFTALAHPSTNLDNHIQQYFNARVLHDHSCSIHEVARASATPQGGARAAHGGGGCYDATAALGSGGGGMVAAAVTALQRLVAVLAGYPPCVGPEPMEAGGQDLRQAICVDLLKHCAV